MQFVTFGEDDYTRLLALGGLHGVSPIADVEFLEEDSGYWLEAWGRLRTARSHSGAVALRPELVCRPCGEHNCPVAQGADGIKELNWFKWTMLKKSFFLTMAFCLKGKPWLCGHPKRVLTNSLK